MPEHATVKITDIVVPDLRVTSQVEDETQAEMTASVSKLGVLQPIQLARCGGKLVLIDGLHRLVACQTLGITEVSAVIEEMTEAELTIRNLLLNRQRGRSNPAEEAELVRYLEEEAHLSLAEIAERTGISRSRIRELLEISKLPKEILALVAQRALGITHAIELLPLIGHEKILQVADDAVLWRYTRDQVALRVKELLHPAPQPAPGSFVFGDQGRPQRVPILCALCATDLADNKSYLWLCGTCVQCASEACKIVRGQGACLCTPLQPPPVRRWLLNEGGEWVGS